MWELEVVEEEHADEGAHAQPQLYDEMEEDDGAHTVKRSAPETDELALPLAKRLKTVRGYTRIAVRESLFLGCSSSISSRRGGAVFGVILLSPRCAPHPSGSGGQQRSSTGVCITV